MLCALEIPHRSLFLPSSFLQHGSFVSVAGWLRFLHVVATRLIAREFARLRLMWRMNGPARRDPGFPGSLATFFRSGIIVFSYQALDDPVRAGLSPRPGPSVVTERGSGIMKIASENVALKVGLLGLALAACGLLLGCGGGDRMESGTQVEVSQDMLDEAAASDAYFDAQSKSGTPKK